MRILTGVWMLNHPTGGLRFLDYPNAIAFFQIVNDLHARPSRRTGLGAEDNLGVRLVAIDGNVSNVHIHGAHVESAHAIEVLQYASADGIVVARLLLATAGQNQHCEQS